MEAHVGQGIRPHRPLAIAELWTLAREIHWCLLYCHQLSVEEAYKNLAMHHVNPILMCETVINNLLRRIKQPVPLYVIRDHLVTKIGLRVPDSLNVMYQHPDGRIWLLGIFAVLPIGIFESHDSLLGVLHHARYQHFFLFNLCRGQM